MIDARYHITVYFEYPPDRVHENFIDCALFDLANKLEDVHELNIFSGTLTRSPYLTCWSSLMEEAEHAEREILKLLREQGCTVQEGA